MNNVNILKEFVKIYYSPTDELYYSLPEQIRYNTIGEKYMISVDDFNATILHIAVKLNLAEFILDDKVAGYKQFNLKLIPEAYEVIDNIKFIRLPNDKPYVEQLGNPNWVLVSSNRLNMNTAFDIAYRKVSIDNVLINIQDLI